MSDYKDSNDTTAAILGRKIEELEKLLERAKESKIESDIPVLDDLVEYDEESVIKQTTANNPGQDVNKVNMDTMLQEIESTIADELDTLVEILKDTIKDSVMTQIKTRLNQTQTDPSDDKN